MARDRSELARDLLRGARLRCTSQRVQVLACLSGMTGHFGAEEALAAVNMLPRPPVSRATLYRLLNDLEQQGILRRVLLSENCSRYEFVGPQDRHCHLVCASCGRVEEVRSTVLDQELRHLGEQYGFSPDRASLEVTVASCNECERQRARELTNGD